jgi:phosphatidylinositol-3-phosphatase
MKLSRLATEAVRVVSTFPSLAASLAVSFTLACGGSSRSTSIQTHVFPPSITTQPQSQTVTAPAAATFTVVAGGTSPLTYQWSENGKAITGAIAPSYTTPPTSAADNGAQFTVIVTNGAGSTTSVPVTLTVNPFPPSLSVTLGSGQSATASTAFNSDLEVKVTDSAGTPIANEFVTFSAPSSGASAIFANGSTTTTAATNTSGIATSSSLTANSTAGSYVVTASVAGASNTASFTLTNLSAVPAIPQFSHIFIVMEENHSFSDVIGNSNMPYLNGLATANSLATHYYADAHPSLPNYFELTVGAGTSITGTSGDSFAGVVTQDNVVRALMAAGKTWKSYAESLPSVGYLGDDTGPYLRHHNPFVYFSDVQNSSAQANNIVPFTQLATDITNDTLPDYAFIVPNVNDDAHNCPVGTTTCTDAQMLAAADQWLFANISPLLASAAFKNSLLIIVFDESVDTDTTHGGGQVPAVLVSPLVRAGYKSTTLYQHESTLRLMMEGLGVTDLPGAAATAPDMVEFFH